MADIPSIAEVMYPALPSAAPAAERAPAAPDRSVYGSPEGGLARARAGIDAGVAKPAAAAPLQPSTEAPKPSSDWLADMAKDRGPEPDVAEPGATEISAPSHLVEQFHELARSSQLSEDSAGRLMKLHEEAIAETSTQFWDKTSSEWEKATRTQFGGRLPEMIAAVQPLLNDRRLTTPGFKALLGQYRLGNNPDVVATLSNWARAMRRR